ncbi:uncharacterized protein [Cherax quadricarinatus]|uniref:uncharacterized protein n=1 Tax=Cherax quadricarinatus TaxID=27406 RepID=UPI002379AFEC|nr:uncharacterized protein LOC128703327 [Cherax quadricarinatus]
MARHILPLVLLVVALVVRLILSAPVGEEVEVNKFHEPLEEEVVNSSIFNSLATRPCPGKCYVRDFRNRCRLKFTCMMG